MKTETQIAKQYIEDLKKDEKPDGRWHIVNRTCHEHKFGGQRFLEFLEAIRFTSAYKGMTKYIKDMIDNKCEDLKQAIKLYREVGIK